MQGAFAFSLVLSLTASGLEPVTESTCAAYTDSAAPEALEDLAGAAGERYVVLVHRLCSSREDLLTGLAPRALSGGWCGELVQDIPVAAPAVRARVGATCAEALRRGVSYAQWSAVVGERRIVAAGNWHEVAALD